MTRWHYHLVRLRLWRHSILSLSMRKHTLEYHTPLSPISNRLFQQTMNFVIIKLTILGFFLFLKVWPKSYSEKILSKITDLVFRWWFSDATAPARLYGLCVQKSICNQKASNHLWWWWFLWNRFLSDFNFLGMRHMICHISYVT